MATVTQIEKLCGDLNREAYEHLGQSDLLPCVEFGGTEATISLGLCPLGLWDDQSCSEEDLDLAKLRKQLADYGAALVAAFGKPLP